jgi:hypothetical protein
LQAVHAANPEPDAIGQLLENVKGIHTRLPLAVSCIFQLARKRPKKIPIPISSREQKSKRWSDHDVLAHQNRTARTFGFIGIHPSPHEK